MRKANRKSYTKNLFREIKGSFSRFAAILAIVAIGTGFYAGLSASSPDMRLSVDKYYSDTNLYDLKMVSTLGLTAEDLADISGTSGVEKVMPVNSADILIDSVSGSGTVTKLISMPSSDAGSINTPVLISGRMPEKAGECVCVENSFMSGKAHIGETVTLSSDNEDLTDTLAVDKFEVVGSVDSSYYFSIEKESSTVGNGEVELILYTPADSFSADYYSEIYVTLDAARSFNSFSDEYSEYINEASVPFEDIGSVHKARRYNQLINDATAELADAEAEYNDKKAEAEEKLSDAKKEIDDAQEKISSGKSEIADGKKAVAEAERKLSDAKAQRDSGKAEMEKGRAELTDRRTAAEKELSARQAELDDGRLKLEQSRKQLETALGQLNELKKQIDAGNASVEALKAAGLYEEAEKAEAALAPYIEQYASGMEELSTGKAEADAAEAALNDGAAALESARTETYARLTAAEQQLSESEAKLKAADEEISAGEKELNSNKAKLSDSEKQLESAAKELETGKAEYESSKAEAEDQLNDGEEKLNDAREEIAKLEHPDWYVFTRQDNLSFKSFKDNCSKVEAIAVIFPVFFFLVAALVALTTMTRMVEEQRVQIGTLKALGYGKAAIIFKYIIYAGMATALGCAVGLSAGMKIFPSVIWNAYGMMYTLPKLYTPFNIFYGTLAAAAAFACTILAAVGACYGSLKEKPAALLLPKAPKVGKRILLEKVPFIWKRLAFTHKVTARNLFRYKKRFLMTVIGISGCTALLVAGFGLKDSIGGIVDKQFGELDKYNLTVVLHDPGDNDAVQLINSNSVVTDYIYTAQESVDISFGSSTDSLSVLVPEQRERLPEYIVLRERKSGKAIDFDDRSAVITEKAAEKLGISVGDTVNVKNSDDISADITITGIAENYVHGYLYISPALYEEAFGASPEYRVITAKTDSDAGDVNELITGLLKTGEVISATLTDNIMETFSDIVTSIDYIVVVLIISAGALALVVLYNLTNINITERQRELATIKVLGFYDKEVSAYIYRETVILTLIGTAVGLVLGIFLHAFVVKTAEVDMVMFGRSVSAFSFIISAALTMVFSVIVNLIMHRRLKKIDMVESLKSGE